MPEQLSEFTDPSGAKGYVLQAHDPGTATYTMIDALLTAVRWIPIDPPLVPGKGVPAFAYMTMRAMKGFGIAPGTLRRLVVCGNHHVESVLQLARQERAGVPLDTAVLETRSYQSVETPMIQSAHRIVRVHVHGGTRDTLANLLAWHAHGGSERRRAIARDRSAEHAGLLKRYAMTSRDTVLRDYEMHVDLLPAGSPR